MSTLDPNYVADSGDLLATADAASPSAIQLKFRFRRTTQKKITVTINSSTTANITQAGARFWLYAGIIPLWARGGAPAGVGIVTGAVLDLLVLGIGTAHMTVSFDQVNGHIQLTPVGADALNTPNSAVDIPAGWIGSNSSLPAVYSFSYDSLY